MSTKILLVGEAWGEREEKAGKPFVGPSGAMLDGFLQAHGLSRTDCYLTNVFNFRPEGNRIPSLCGPKAAGIPKMPPIDSGKYVLAKYKPELDRLYKEITDVNPNVIVALGGTACWALLHDRRIKRLRGAPLQGVTGHKVLPTYHPAAILREYKLRPIVFSDFAKVRRESAFPEIVRPRRELWLEPDINDLRNFERFITASRRICADIETWNRRITCIGFAPSVDRAIVIPFLDHTSEGCNYWPTLEAELEALSFVRRWLSLGKCVINQNILYDASYLWKIYGIPIYHITDDTMLLHHAMQPEMEKGLAFLGPLYLDEPQWKFLREGSSTLKKED